MRVRLYGNKVKRLILASASPRRRELLSSLKLDFEVCVTDADERIENDVSASETVRILAFRKASAARERFPNDTVIAADTVVLSADGDILGKPSSDREAEKMLRMLSGSRHTVYTGVCVMSEGSVYQGVESTDVFMRDITDEEISDYIRTGEPSDKAGAYGIQGLGGIFVTKIDGEYFNVTGMPKSLTAKLLSLAGVNVLKHQ